MNMIGASTDAVQQIGRKVHQRGPAATAAATSLLDSYDDAAATVVHPKMTSALTTYRDANQRGHLQLADEIQRLGANTAEGGATFGERAEREHQCPTAVLRDRREPVPAGRGAASAVARPRRGA